MPIEMRNALIWLFLGTISCLIAYEYIDQPVAFWVFNEGINKISWLKKLTYLPVVLTAITMLGYLFLFVRFCFNRFSSFDKNIFLMANTIATTFVIKSVLKILFARYWPITWIRNNPSLIHDGVYGFKWLHMGSNYGAFPSGHSAVMAAGMITLSMSYPKLSWCFAILWFLVAIGLVGMDYHFVSDVIGGATLAGITAYSMKFALFNSLKFKKA